MQDIEKRVAEMRKRIAAAFPFKRVEVPGTEALATWEKLKTQGHGCPVILGGEESAFRMMEPFDPSWPEGRMPVADVLKAAEGLKMPDALFARRAEEDKEADEHSRKWAAEPDANLPTIVRTDDSERGATIIMRLPRPADGSAPQPPTLGPHDHVLTPDETRAWLLRENIGPKVGEWPAEAPPSAGLTVATDIVSGAWLPNVQIAVIPTDDWTTIPAHLKYGNWNDCPPAEYHVAVLRSWRDRYGVELIGLAADTMNLRAARRPQSREEALSLAREHYAYCTDIVDQGCETFSNLAATLMAHDWWFFWWD